MTHEHKRINRLEKPDADTPLVNLLNRYQDKFLVHAERNAIFPILLKQEVGKNDPEKLERLVEYLEKQIQVNNDEVSSFDFTVLAVLNKRGIGVPKSHEKYLSYLEKAATVGDAEALHRLGWLYENGERGEYAIITKDINKAIDYYQKAANQEHPAALYNLGKLYEDGRGVEADITQALEYYHRAANQKYPNALYRLGMMYAEGVGVEKNVIQAAFYFREAFAKKYLMTREREAQMNKFLRSSCVEYGIQFVSAKPKHHSEYKDNVVYIYTKYLGLIEEGILAYSVKTPRGKIINANVVDRLDPVYWSILKPHYDNLRAILRQHPLPAHALYESDESLDAPTRTAISIFINKINEKKHAYHYVPEVIYYMSMRNPHSQSNLDDLALLLHEQPGIFLELFLRDMRSSDYTITQQTTNVVESLLQAHQIDDTMALHQIKVELALKYMTDQDVKNAARYLFLLKPDWLTAEQNFNIGFYLYHHQQELAFSRLLSDALKQSLPWHAKIASNTDNKLVELIYIHLSEAAKSGNQDAKRLLVSMVCSRMNDAERPLYLHYVNDPSLAFPDTFKKFSAGFSELIKNKKENVTRNQALASHPPLFTSKKERKSSAEEKYIEDELRRIQFAFHPIWEAYGKKDPDGHAAKVLSDLYHLVYPPLDEDISSSHVHKIKKKIAEKLRPTAFDSMGYQEKGAVRAALKDLQEAVDAIIDDTVKELSKPRQRR